MWKRSLFRGTGFKLGRVLQATVASTAFLDSCGPTTSAQSGSCFFEASFRDLIETEKTEDVALALREASSYSHQSRAHEEHAPIRSGS